MIAAVGDIQWEQIGVGVAAVLGLVYVARTMQKVVKDTISSISRLNDATLTWLTNHMSNISSSMEAVAINLQTLNERVDRLHDDAVAAAAVMTKTAEGEIAALKEFEARVRERHLMLAEKLPGATRRALTLAMEEELDKPQKRTRKKAES